MDHNHSEFDAGGVTNQHQGIQGDHHSHVSNIIDKMREGEENELLEMLHVPILHGGVKEILLLSTLATSSAGSFALACLVLVVCVVLLELLRLLAWWVENQYSGGSSMMSPTCACKQCNSLTANAGDRKQYDALHDSSTPVSEASSAHLNASTHTTAASRLTSWACVGGLQFLLYLVSTLLMLIAMTMNIYLIVSMALGSAIGKITVVCVKKKLLDAQRK